MSSQMLLKHKCEINIANNAGWTALHFAANDGHIQIVQDLLRCNDCDVGLRTEENESALHLAAARGHFTVVQALLANKNKPIFSQMNDRNLAEVASLAYNDANVVDLKYRAHLERIFYKLVISDIKHQHDDVFAHTIEIASTRLCKVMLEKHPAFVDSCFSDGETALHCAIRIDSYEKCKLILDNNFNLDTTWNDQTALEYALCYCENTEIIDALVDRTDNRDDLVTSCTRALLVGESVRN